MSEKPEDLQGLEEPFSASLGEFFERHKFLRGAVIGLLAGTAVWAVLEFLRGLMPFDVFSRFYMVFLLGLVVLFILYLSIKR